MEAADQSPTGSKSAAFFAFMGKVKHVLEAKLQPSGATGREWEVVVIGAQQPGDVVTVDGREYIRSAHGRLYSVDAIEESAPRWEGVKVFDDHQTEEEFERRHGWRSPKNEWLGALTNPRFVREGNLPQLRATLKVVEDTLATKLKNAWELGVLGSIGLSITTFVKEGARALVEGQSMPIIEGFHKILSVDLVGEAAAGGGFVRLLASVNLDEEIQKMNKDELAELLDEKLGAFEEKLPGVVQQHVNSALAEAQAAEPDVDDMDDEEVVEALANREANREELRAEKARQEATKAKREADLARTQLMLTQKLERAKLPQKFQEAVEAQFEGRVVDGEVIDKAIKHARDAYASLDPSGRVRAGEGRNIAVGVNEDERVELEFMRRLMGAGDFGELEQSDDPSVKQLLGESKAYKSWKNNGKPNLPGYPRISMLLYDWFGGDPLLDHRAFEAATTSSLATVVKNTVNIMAANRYSQRERWFEPIVRTMEVDTIDDATLARVYGIDALDTVAEGQAYTELDLQDDEETASFVKRGNYIGVTLETLMRDKIQEIRNIPTKLADAWYNTQSDLVSNVFTVNTAAGPVLGDSGALFNATALSSAGGHANLLTSALSHANYSAARVAMRKQTDQPLGAGRKLLIRPRYMLVPVDLETTALEIRNSELQPEADGSSTTGNQTVNQFRGEFDVIVVPTWTDTDNWALVADPAQYPAIWLIYPRGQRTPQIFAAESETGGSMFTNDTLRFKARLMTYRFSATYDCAPVSDFRPLHKSNV